MNLLDLIPYGHENAITREKLKRLTHLPDRVMRAKIQDLRCRHAILNMQDGRGYFRPLESEYALVKLWLGQTRSRARECTESLNGASAWLLVQSTVLEGQETFAEVGRCPTA